MVLWRTAPSKHPPRFGHGRAGRSCLHTSSKCRFTWKYNQLNIWQHLSVCEPSWILNVLGWLGFLLLRFTHGICQGVQDVMRVTPWQVTLKPPKKQHNIRACLTSCCTLSHLISVAFESPTEALGTLLHASRQALDCNSPGVTESDTNTIKDPSMRTKHNMTTFLGRAWMTQRKGALKSW